MPTEIEIRDGRLEALQSRDAEIERLRSALGEIADLPSVQMDEGPSIARRALEQEADGQ